MAGERKLRARSRVELALCSLFALVALPGCPLSDDYFVDPNAGAAGTDTGSSGSGGSGGMMGTGGKTPKGGAAGVDSMGGGGMMAGGAGSGGSGGAIECEEPCNAPRACMMMMCQDGWITTSTPPGGFSPREKAAYTSIGNQLFIWGGVNESGTALNSGALYDPRTDEWTMVASDANTPSPRSLATAVWTGSVIVVWGGLDPISMEPLGDGAIYDPVMNTWSPMSPGPTARAATVGAPVADRVVFFGGLGSASAPLGGLDAYDFDRDVWEPGMENSPAPVADPAAAGGTLTFWTHGGRTDMNAGVSDSSYYSMSTERWVESESLSPGRWGSFAAFTDSFFVWGGRDVDDVFNDGASHSPGAFDWDQISSRGAPSARFATDRESGWTFVMDAASNDAKIVIIGGLTDPNIYVRDGGIYEVERDNWRGIPEWPSQASHTWGAAGIAAGELVVWGGRSTGTTITNEGVRYLPQN